MNFSLVIDPAKDDIEEIRGHLIKYNDANLNGEKEEPVAIFVTGDDGNKIAGITAELWGQWLIVKLLWVSEAHRAEALGKTLLTQLEAFAVSRGCTKALVDTFSFQARPFYEIQGYVCQWTLDDYPTSTKLHFLVKDLVNGAQLDAAHLRS
ncbi:GNAT family N-acetyltransferase [Enterovibrio sp. ZSDZ35]|uniref:GNAT family N-acetyltransferase n=1 Tax=Enterovibrio qingdaonensis TaxID=2899818 RepID=A0ABT5QGR9_9GAMM|nr:GNAT family N-acetyltransferase [Enterovibrio sp. ZSDZ35]MDD1780182.1 GNAT family N-acetyltransferase [Enterovibrio sp. ZSDZ35]